MRNQTIITFTTDFGDDFALAQVIASLLSINPSAKPMIISNSVSKFSIIEGAFFLSESCNLFPNGSIHVGVIDPTVGTERKGIIIETQKYFFVGPNNGLFYPSAKNIKQIYLIDERAINKNHSTTFHGRDIFAKVAGLISKGENINNYASKLKKSVLRKVKFKKNQILHIDDYGNIKINNSCKEFKIGDILKVSKKGFVSEFPFVKTFANVPEGSNLAYRGSHNILELSKNLGSVSEEVKLKVGDVVLIKKLK